VPALPGALALIVQADRIRKYHNRAPTFVVVMRVPRWLFEAVAHHPDSALALGNHYVAVVPGNMRATARRTHKLNIPTEEGPRRLTPPRWRSVSELEEASNW
jgi:hypothetical protein